ncbi:hypothetical protein [Sorangium sp. So ce1014]
MSAADLVFIALAVYSLTAIAEAMGSLFVRTAEVLPPHIGP